VPPAERAHLASDEWRIPELPSRKFSIIEPSGC
jgi:hypothetical protein